MNKNEKIILIYTISFLPLLKNNIGTMNQKVKNKQIAVTTDFDFQYNRLINLSTPSGLTDAVNKSYVDVNAINYAIGTGLYSGGMITIDDNTHFSITSGVSYLVDPVSKITTELTFPEHTGVTLMDISGTTVITISVGIDSSGEVYQQIPLFSAYQRRSMICLGELFVDPNTKLLDRVRFRPVFSWDTSTAVDDAIIAGIININGNTVSSSGSSLQMNISSGTMHGYSINAVTSFSLPNERFFNSGATFPFYTTYHNGTEWVYQSTGTTLDPDVWSNGTPTLQHVPDNQWSVKLLMRGSMNGRMYISYPTMTDTFLTDVDAINSIDSLGVTIPDELVSSVLPCSFLIVRGAATDLSDTNDAVFVPIKSYTISAGGASTTYAVNVIFDNSTTTGITSGTAQGAIVEINNKIENLDYNSDNIEMDANSGTSGIYLATDVTVSQIPRTRIRVEVNSIEVTVGNGIKTKQCYFSGDNGTTAKTYSNVAFGDKLYWNGDTAGYQLDLVDTITFIYMTF